MRRLVYGVAASLDGFIAGPKGEVDWILPDSGIDFRALYSKYDTALMGRRTHEVASTRGDLLRDMRLRIVMVSTTVDPVRLPGITVIDHAVVESVRALKAEAGKDIWLFGGRLLFRTLLDAALIDAIEVSVFPVLSGSGTPLVGEGHRASLTLESCKPLPSGVLMLSYSVSMANPARHSQAFSSP